METITQTNLPIPQIGIPLTPEFEQELQSFATRHGVRIHEAIVMLCNVALRADNLNLGVVSELSTKALHAIQEEVLTAIKTTEEARLAKDQEAAGDSNSAVAEHDLVFSGSPELTEIINAINSQRAEKGLAPVQRSPAELLLFWGEGVAQMSVLKEITGFEYQWFRQKMRELAEAEREVNGAQSNVITPSGFLGRLNIVNTPREVA